MNGRSWVDGACRGPLVVVTCCGGIWWAGGYLLLLFCAAALPRVLGPLWESLPDCLMLFPSLPAANLPGLWGEWFAGAHSAFPQPGQWPHHWAHHHATYCAHNSRWVPLQRGPL